MFEQLAASQQIRTALRLTSEYRANISVFDRRGGSVAVVVVVTSRNTGQVDAELAGLWPNNVESVLASGTIDSGANEAIYLLPTDTIPATLRVTVTPSGGFDGNVQVWLRSAGSVATLTPLT